MCNIHRRGKRNVKIAFNIFDFCMQIIAHVACFYVCISFTLVILLAPKINRAINAISLFA